MTRRPAAAGLESPLWEPPRQSGDDATVKQMVSYVISNAAVYDRATMHALINYAQVSDQQRREVGASAGSEEQDGAVLPGARKLVNINLDRVNQQCLRAMYALARRFVEELG